MSEEVSVAPVVVITLDGGLVSSVTTDSEALLRILGLSKIVVVDYDCDGMEADDMVRVHFAGAPLGSDEFEPDSTEAFAHLVPISATDIDTVDLMSQILDEAGSGD